MTAMERPWERRREKWKKEGDIGADKGDSDELK